jgi:hypothetical protein
MGTKLECLSREAVEALLTGVIADYEECQESSRAQSDLGQASFGMIKICLEKLGLDYCAKNLAAYGHKRSGYYCQKYPDLREGE